MKFSRHVFIFVCIMGAVPFSDSLYAGVTIKNYPSFLEKQGWKVFPGDAPIKAQLDTAELYEHAYDTDTHPEGMPLYIKGATLSDVQPTLQKAEEQAIERAKFAIYSQYQTEIDNALEVFQAAGDNSTDEKIMVSYESSEQTCMGEVIATTETEYRDGKKIHSSTKVNWDAVRRTCFTYPIVKHSFCALRFYRVVDNGYQVAVKCFSSDKTHGKKIGQLFYGLDPVRLTAKVEHSFTYSYLTDITIPKQVSDNLWTYNVIGIEEDAFAEAKKLQELHYPKGIDVSKLTVPAGVNLIVDNPYPPMLAIVDGTLKFSDATHNNCIDAKENCSITFDVANNGKGKAEECEVRIKVSGASNGITTQNIPLPEIAAGETQKVTIPIGTGHDTKDGKVTFSIEVYEPSGWGVAPFDLTVATKAFEQPFLQVVDYNITSPTGKIKKMEPFTLTFNLQNTKYGDAEMVKVNIKLPANVFIMDGTDELSFAQIKSGEAVPISIVLAVNNNYSATDVPITIDVKERYGKYAENKKVNVALNSTASNSINIAAKDDANQGRKEIQLALMSSDVDRDIPKTDVQNANTFVVIIANENYDQVSHVPFAINDGKMFRQYCEQVLGVPENNIREVYDATNGKIKRQINWLAEIAQEFTNPNIIFYYSGHGMKDEKNLTSYILPVDGFLSDVSTCFKLEDLYTTLGAMPAALITVFIDACFSGSERGSGMLAKNAKGIANKALPGTPKGNTVVFSAAQGDETAYPYEAKQHGMFTYYLLKKLQETKGDVTLQELGDYITTNVKQQSLTANSKKQTPSVRASDAIGSNWKNWKLK